MEGENNLVMVRSTMRILWSMTGFKDPWQSRDISIQPARYSQQAVPLDMILFFHGENKVKLRRGAFACRDNRDHLAVSPDDAQMWYQGQDRQHFSRTEDGAESGRNKHIYPAVGQARAPGQQKAGNQVLQDWYNCNII